MPVAFVGIAAHMGCVIHHLKIAMCLDHPRTLFAHKGAQNGGGIFVMIIGRIDIANVMQQGRYNPINIGSIAPRTCGGLHRMAQTGDLIS